MTKTTIQSNSLGKTMFNLIKQLENSAPLYQLLNYKIYFKTPIHSALTWKAWATGLSIKVFSEVKVHNHNFIFKQELNWDK